MNAFSILSKGCLGERLFTRVFDKHAHAILKELLRPVLCRLISRYIADLGLRALVQLVETHVVQWVVLVVAVVDLEAVNFEVLWAQTAAFGSQVHVLTIDNVLRRDALIPIFVDD